MREAIIGPPPDVAGKRSRQDTSTKSVDYFFDQPNAIRRPANMTAMNYVPVLAAFDADNAIIWANEALFNVVERNRRAHYQLRDEDVETLTHEFARVLQYRDIFEDHLTQSDRIEALRKRRSRIVSRSTTESYMNHRLFQERQAEAVVQQVRMEILCSFDRAQHGTGLSASDMSQKVEELTSVFIKDLKQEYRSCARREFARLKSHRGDDARPTNCVEDRYGGDRYKELSIHKLRCLFPVRQSPTLADLVDEIIGLRMKIVVPISAGNS